MTAVATPQEQATEDVVARLREVGAETRRLAEELAKMAEAERADDERR